MASLKKANFQKHFRKFPLQLQAKHGNVKNAVPKILKTPFIAKIAENINNDFKRRLN